MATYVSVADWRQRYDEREIAQLVSDDGSAVDLGDLDTNEVALDILQDAEGEVLAAIKTGGRYSDDDLAGLDDAGTAYLKRLICELATTFLNERRFDYDPDKYAAREKRIRERLDDLRNGKNVFGLTAEIEAGKPVLAVPSLVQRSSQTLIRDRTGNYFPAVRLPNQ